MRIRCNWSPGCWPQTNTGSRRASSERSMRFAELESRDTAIWGCGREGRAALAALRRRFPDKPLTVYCNHEEALALRPVATPSPPNPPLEGEGSTRPVPSTSLLHVRTETPDAK